MTGGPESSTAPFSPIDSLNVFASLLGEVETATPVGAFYNRLAEAVCRLGSMRRAVVFVYDDVARRVRVVGAHRVDLGVFDGHILAIETAPVAGRALALDQVIEGTADDLPEPYDTALGIEYFACVPLAAGGRGFGVIVADRAARTRSEIEREVLWSLGKVCALALRRAWRPAQQVDAPPPRRPHRPRPRHPRARRPAAVRRASWRSQSGVPLLAERPASAAAPSCGGARRSARGDRSARWPRRPSS